MAAPLSLEKIIRNECMPVLDCMLTVTDSTGDSAFLYFKEGELVEANFASLWGRDALTEILNWTICVARHRVAAAGHQALALGAARGAASSRGQFRSSGRLTKGRSSKRASSQAGLPGSLDRYTRPFPTCCGWSRSARKETVLFDATGEKGARRSEPTGWSSSPAACARWGKRSASAVATSGRSRPTRTRSSGFARDDQVRRARPPQGRDAGRP